jgi:hypothetical protein
VVRVARERTITVRVGTMVRVSLMAWTAAFGCILADTIEGNGLVGRWGLMLALVATALLLCAIIGDQLQRVTTASSRAGYDIGVQVRELRGEMDQAGQQRE